MQVLEQWCAKKTLSQGLNIFKKCLGNLSSWNNEDLSLFIEEKRVKLAFRGLTVNMWVNGWLAVSI